MSERYYSKVIRITAEDSPNVKLGLLQQRMGVEPTGQTPDGKPVVDGVLPWSMYAKWRATLSKIMQTIRLDALFYEGIENLLYPPEWLARSNSLWYRLDHKKRRLGLAMGVDCAQGGDNTAMCVGDKQGIIEESSEKTPDTSVIKGKIKAMAQRNNVAATNILLDQGGGGKQIGDEMRKEGWPVRIIAFGGSPTPPVKIGETTYKEKIDKTEDRHPGKFRRPVFSTAPPGRKTRRSG